MDLQALCQKGRSPSRFSWATGTTLPLPTSRRVPR